MSDQAANFIGALVRGLVYGNPAIEQIKARGIDLAAFARELEAAYRREFGGNPNRLPLQTITFEARRP